MTPATPAVHKIIRTLRSPISITDLIQEVNELLEYEGKSATYSEIMVSIGFACQTGADAILKRFRPDGSFFLPTEPPALLILDDTTAIPITRAEDGDIVAHVEFMKQLLAHEATARKPGGRANDQQA